MKQFKGPTKQRGFFDMIDKALTALAVICVAVIGSVVGLIVGGPHLKKAYEERFDKSEYRDRASEILQQNHLQTVTLGTFKNDYGCQDAERPLTAVFKASTIANEVVEGRVCLAPNREARLKINP